MRLIYEAYMFEDPEMLKGYWGPMAVEYFSPDAAAWMHERDEKQREAAAKQQREMMAQMMAMGGPPGMGPPPLPPGPPGMEGMGGEMPPGMAGGPPLPGMGLDSTVLPPDMQAVTGMPGAGDPQSVEALLAMLAQNGGPPPGMGD